jgi:Dolichyl-phosphate-mannose-protein mannosyltransferase
MDALRPGWFRQSGVLLVAILAGLLLRCFHVESHELQYDEAATGYFAALPWADLWGGPAVLEPNPPLFYSLAWLVSRAGGTVEHIRYISVAAGVLSIPLVWLIARQIAGVSAAACAVLLVASSPQHIAICQYARCYALLILCLLCALYCLMRGRQSGLEQIPARRFYWWAGYATASVAALYTHHTAIVMLAALNLVAAFFAIRAGSAGWRTLGGLFAANLVVGVLYAPWLPVIAAQAVPSGAPAIAKTVHAATLLQRLSSVSLSSFPFRGLPWVDIWMLPAAALAAWRFRSSKDMGFFLSFLLCGLVLMVLASQLHPLIDGKTLAWAGLFALAAAGIGCSAAGMLRWPLLAILILLQLRSMPAAVDPAPEGWREVAGTLREKAHPQDALFLNYAGALLPLRHYGWNGNEAVVKVFAKSNDEAWFRDWIGPALPPQEVARKAAQAGRVWFLTYGDTAQSREIASALEARSVRKLHARTAKLALSLFEPGEATAAEQAGSR